MPFKIGVCFRLVVPYNSVNACLFVFRPFKIEARISFDGALGPSKQWLYSPTHIPGYVHQHRVAALYRKVAHVTAKVRGLFSPVDSVYCRALYCPLVPSLVDRLLHLLPGITAFIIAICEPA